MFESNPDATHSHTNIDSFITTWKASGGAERANYQLFLSELCLRLGAPLPEPTYPRS